MKLYPTRIVFLVLGILSILAGLLLSPQLMIRLGPMRGSLTNENSLVRNSAELEIVLFKVAAIIAGVVFFLIWLMWSRVIKGRLVQFLIDQGEAEDASTTGIFNLSFFVMIVSSLASFIFLAVAEKVMSKEQALAIAFEDGFVENGSAVLFLLAAIVAGIVAFIGDRTAIQKATMLVFAFGLFFIAGEEISWGQRIFGVETMDSLKEIDVQGENNLHNAFGYLADHLFIAGVFVLGVVIPFLYRRYQAFRGFFRFFGFPIASVGLGIGVFVISMAHQWLVEAFVDIGYGLRVAEPREFLSSLAFFLLMMETFRRSRSRSTEDSVV